MSGSQQQQPPSAGANLQFGPQATDQNGQLQRLLQAQPQLQGQGQPAFGQQAMQATSQALSQRNQQGLLSSPQGMAGPTQDPNLAATMQGLLGLQQQAKANKMAIAKAMMGG